MRDVNNKKVKGKKDSLPFKEKINIHGNDIPIPKLEGIMTKEGQKKTNVPSVVVTNPITSIIDITQVEKQIITSEAEKLKKEAKRIINEMQDYDSSNNNNIEIIRKHYKSHQHHHRDNLETKTDEIQNEGIEDSDFGEIEEKKHKHSRHRHHH